MLIRKQKKRLDPAIRALISILVVLALVAGYFAFRWLTRSGVRSSRVMTWIREAAAHPEWAIQAGSRCGQASFQMPTSGYIGFLWDDSFRPGHHHQGLDIFGGQEPGVTPVYAAYSGYLTRLPEWKSSLIVRIPVDPLQPTRQIWTYYTHLANEDGTSYVLPAFPAGTTDVYVEAGTLLGYQGNYSGDPNNPTGIHLHFSIVQDDGSGKFMNELKIQNTLDPSPYFGMVLNARQDPPDPPRCPEVP